MNNNIIISVKYIYPSKKIKLIRTEHMIWPLSWLELPQSSLSSFKQGLLFHSFHFSNILFQILEND